MRVGAATRCGPAAATMTMDRIDLSPGIVYRAEGNANMVVAIQGTGMVLRLPKSKMGETCEPEKLLAMEKFINSILNPRLGDFTPFVSVVVLDKEQLETIRTTVTSFRPEKRLSKNIYSPYALVMNDQCYLAENDGKYPIISVEIKPKQGFLSQNNNGQTCNFCIKQNYLSKTGKDGGLKSKYCPLDLFSGNSTRMERAIESLMEIPKNNLRIFMDGTLLHDENSTKKCDTMITELFQSRSAFRRTLLEMLTSDTSAGELSINGHNQEFSIKEETKALSRRDKLSCHNDTETLPKNCVLDRILRLQTCSTSDVEAEKLVKNITFHGINKEEIQKIISGDDQIPDDFSEEATKNILTLQQYCMSVTAKDLSIILTLSQKDVKDESEDSNQIIVDDKIFRYKLSIIDLDQKSLNKIPHYIENKRLWSSI